ncbi:MAG TPA: hypothetical protein VMT69_11420 [Kineosporiaceae bacterium]|nr:hypothetical protein [Kineosporiaceae bacterium]
MRVSVGAAATVLAGVVAVGIAGTAFARSSASPPLLKATVNGTAQTPQGTLPHAFLQLDTWPDSLAGPHGKDGGPHPDWVSYGPSTNLAVPAHSLVTVTIRQYDTGEEITNPFFAAVHGTVDGTMTVDGATVRSADPEHIGHTFTVHGLASNKDPLFVSVPLPAVADDAPVRADGYPAPHVVTFSFVTGGPADYVWQCEFPCGDGTYAKFGGPMSEQTYMSGTLTVTAQA